jgi:hypothetical protein
MVSALCKIRVMEAEFIAGFFRQSQWQIAVYLSRIDRSCHFGAALQRP